LAAPTAPESNTHHAEAQINAHAKLPQIKALKRPALTVSTSETVEFLDSKPPAVESPADPKVNIPFSVKEGETPRRVMLERRKREYAHQDLDALFQALTTPAFSLADDEKTKIEEMLGVSPGKSIHDVLSLDLFDNTDLETRTIAEWLDVSEKDFKKQYGTVLAKESLEASVLDQGAWMRGRVTGYNKETHSWLFSPLQGEQRQVNRYL
jgi:hypothetical protein